MAQKQITKSRVETVRVCDLCSREMNHFGTCQICQRDACHSCRSFVCLYDSTPGLIDIGMNVCADCKAAGEDVAGATFLELMKAVVRESDAALMRLLNRWRTWAKERGATP